MSFSSEISVKLKLLPQRKAEL